MALAPTRRCHGVLRVEGKLLHLWGYAHGSLAPTQTALNAKRG